MRVFFAISVMVSKMFCFKHGRLRFAGKTETLFKFFQQPERLFEKSSCQSLSIICVVNKLRRQFEVCTCYISAFV